jgi:hypothetical protein
MERDLTSSHIEERNENTQNVVHGGQVTDADLLKAGVEEIKEDNVANVDLVRVLHSSSKSLLTSFCRRQLWGLTSQIHGGKGLESCTLCASWCIFAQR